MAGLCATPSSEDSAIFVVGDNVAGKLIVDQEDAAQDEWEDWPQGNVRIEQRA